MTEEELMVQDFITNIKNTRYSKVMKMLVDTVECKYMYNGYYHDLLCTLWDNLLNDNAVTNIGLKIQSRGGNDALRNCVYIIMNVLRYLTNNDTECRYIIVHSIKDHISSRWACLGDWQYLLFVLILFLDKLFCIVIYNV